MHAAYIFDLDGTLLDTLASLADSFNRTLEAAGFPQHPIASYRYFVGDGLRACVERCLPPDARTEVQISQLMDAQQQDYESSWNTATPYTGIISLLDELATRSARLAVLSNKNHSFTVRCIEHYFPGRFEIIQGYSGDFAHKPDPTAAHDVCNRLGMKPAEVAFVGDTATDIKTAVACGNYPIGVLWGFREADELLDAGAAQLVATPLEIIEGESP